MKRLVPLLLLALLAACAPARDAAAPQVLVSWTESSDPPDAPPPDGGPQPEPYVPDPEQPLVVHRLRITNPTDRPVVVTLADPPGAHPTTGATKPSSGAGARPMLTIPARSTRVLTVRAALGQTSTLAATIRALPTEPDRPAPHPPGISSSQTWSNATIASTSRSRSPASSSPRARGLMSSVRSAAPSPPPPSTVISNALSTR